MTFNGFATVHAHPCWTPINELLIDLPKAVAHFGIKPYSLHDVNTTNHDKVVEFFSEWVRPAGFTDDDIYSILYMEVKYGEPTAINKFLRNRMDTLAKYIVKGGFLYELEDAKQVRFVLSELWNNEKALEKVQDFVAWYKKTELDLEAVNYGSWPFSCASSIETLFDSMVSFAVEHEQLNSALFARTSPAWFSFVKHLKTTTGVNLIPDEKEIRNAAATLLANSRVPEYTHVDTPLEYWSWGMQEKFLWDIENNEEYRSRIFLRDKEMSAMWVAHGGATKEFKEWLEKR